MALYKTFESQEACRTPSLGGIMFYKYVDTNVPSRGSSDMITAIKEGVKIRGTLSIRRKVTLS